MGVGVDVDGVAAEEGGDGDAAGVGEVYGEAGGGGDGGDDGDAGDECLEDDLEGEAAADEQHAVAQGQVAVEQGAADELVHGVVAADVFAQGEQGAGGVEEGGGVEAAGVGEDGLAGAEAVGQGVEQVGGDGEGVRRERREGGAGGGDAVLAADAATGVDGETAGVALVAQAAGEVYAGGGDDVEGVVGGEAVGVGAGTDGGELGCVRDQPFGMEEAGGKLGVVAGG